jgi:hypothetical protein
MNKYLFIVKSNNKVHYYTFQSTVSIGQLKQQLNNILLQLDNLATNNNYKTLKFNNISLSSYDSCELYLFDNFYKQHLINND